VAQHATAQGTAAYRRRFDGQLAPGHFRTAQGWCVSSIGLGTYLGEADSLTDASYRNAIGVALQRGCNLIDAAINYRFQRSERSIGEALAAAISAQAIRREEVVISTKGGYLPFDSAPPQDPSQWFYDTIVSTGVATFDDVVAGCHCMTPSYLQHQLATSLRNLRLHCVDIYYLHNPETQLSAVSREAFSARLIAAFAQLEEAVAAGQIQRYGVATWNGLRQPEEARDHLSLAEMLRVAEQVGGPQHHFRVVQVPFNLAMPEALTRRNQRVDGAQLSLLSAAAQLGITVTASASLLQGRLGGGLPAELATVFGGLETDAQRAIQFARSAPGVTTALVGMKQAQHVEENLTLAHVSPTSPAQFMQLFRQTEPAQ
jgi:aryl-alcohol dehydrogenase-like predicted oxidoreductase